MKRKPIDPMGAIPVPPRETDLGDFPISHPSTGTVDDDDDPADEQQGENEAEVGETQDSTEAPEEFQRDEEDR